MPPATPLNYVPWVLICFTFNYVIRRRHFGWWSKYNCELFHDEVIGMELVFLTRDGSWINFQLDVLSAGLDAGYAVGILLVYFALQYPMNGTIGQNTVQKWWGNTVHINTGDYKGVPLKGLTKGEKFGPTSW
jgi:hypothetical protein